MTRPRSRLNKFRPSTTTEVTTTLDPRLPKKTPTEIFEKDQESRRRTTTEKPSVKVIFNSIPVDKGFANVLPPDYQVRTMREHTPHMMSAKFSGSFVLIQY